MNPIANLPATQNLNRPQQSQGYNRQYFGGDEVDQFELSQEAEEAAAEEQKKKKIWAYAAGIGAAIVAGAAVLLGLRATGHATWAKLGNNENSLTGLTKLSKKGTGDEVKKGATLAEGAMKGTLSGGSWNGISTSITGSASQYDNIIFIGKEENYKALKEKITDSAITNKLKHIACETWASLQKEKNFTDNIDKEKVAFIVDTDLRNAEGGSVYEKIKEFWDKGDSASGETKAEEKKETETTSSTTTEAGKPEEGTTTTETDETRKPEANGNTSVQQNPPTAQGAAAGETPVVATTTATTTATSQAPIPEGSGPKLNSLAKNADESKKALEEENFGVVDEKGKPKDVIFVAIDEQVTELNNKHTKMKPLVKKYEQDLEELVAEANNAQKRLAEIDSRLKELNELNLSTAEQEERTRLKNEKADIQKSLKSLVTDTDTDTDKPLKAKTGTGTETEYESNSKYMPASLENYNNYVDNIKSTPIVSTDINEITTQEDIDNNRETMQKLQAQQTALNHIKADLESQAKTLVDEVETKKKAAAEAKKKVIPNNEMQKLTSKQETLSSEVSTLQIEHKALLESKSLLDKSEACEQDCKSVQKLTNTTNSSNPDATKVINDATKAIDNATKAIDNATESAQPGTKKVLTNLKNILNKIKKDLALESPITNILNIKGDLTKLAETLKSITGADTATAKTAIEQAQTAIEDSKEYKKYVDTKKAYDANTSQIKAKETEIKAKEAEIKAKEAEVEKVGKEITTAEAASNAVKTAEEAVSEATKAAETAATAAGMKYDPKKGELTAMSDTDIENITDDNHIAKKQKNLQKVISKYEQQLAKYTTQQPKAQSAS